MIILFGHGDIGCCEYRFFLFFGQHCLWMLYSDTVLSHIILFLFLYNIMIQSTPLWSCGQSSQTFAGSRLIPNFRSSLVVVCDSAVAVRWPSLSRFVNNRSSTRAVPVPTPESPTVDENVGSTAAATRTHSTIRYWFVEASNRSSRVDPTNNRDDLQQYKGIRQWWVLDERKRGLWRSFSLRNGMKWNLWTTCYNASEWLHHR